MSGFGSILPRASSILSRANLIGTASPTTASIMVNEGRHSSVEGGCARTSESGQSTLRTGPVAHEMLDELRQSIEWSELNKAIEEIERALKNARAEAQPCAIKIATWDATLIEAKHIKSTLEKLDLLLTDTNNFNLEAYQKEANQFFVSYIVLSKYLRALEGLPGVNSDELKKIRQPISLSVLAHLICLLLFTKTLPSCFPLLEKLQANAQPAEQARIEPLIEQKRHLKNVDIALALLGERFLSCYRIMRGPAYLRQADAGRQAPVPSEVMQALFNELEDVSDLISSQERTAAINFISDQIAANLPPNRSVSQKEQVDATTQTRPLTADATTQTGPLTVDATTQTGPLTIDATTQTGPLTIDAITQTEPLTQASSSLQQASAQQIPPHAVQGQNLAVEEEVRRVTAQKKGKGVDRASQRQGEQSERGRTQSENSFEERRAISANLGGGNGWFKHLESFHQQTSAINWQGERDRRLEGETKSFTQESSSEDEDKLRKPRTSSKKEKVVDSTGSEASYAASEASSYANFTSQFNAQVSSSESDSEERLDPVAKSDHSQEVTEGSGTFPQNENKENDSGFESSNLTASINKQKAVVDQQSSDENLDVSSDEGVDTSAVNGAKRQAQLLSAQDEEERLIREASIIRIDLSELESKLSSLKAERERLTQTVRELEESKQARRQKIAVSGNGANEFDVANNRITLLKKKKEVLQGQISDYEKSEQNFDLELGTVQCESERCKEEILLSEIGIGPLNKQLESDKRVVKKFEKMLEQSSGMRREEIETLKKIIEKRADVIEGTERQIAFLESEKEKLEEQASSLAERELELEAKLLSARNEKEGLKQRSLSLNQELLQLRAELSPANEHELMPGVQQSQIDEMEALKKALQKRDEEINATNKQIKLLETKLIKLEEEAVRFIENESMPRVASTSAQNHEEQAGPASSKNSETENEAIGKLSNKLDDVTTQIESLTAGIKGLERQTSTHSQRSAEVSEDSVLIWVSDTSNPAQSVQIGALTEKIGELEQGIAGLIERQDKAQKEEQKPSDSSGSDKKKKNTWGRITSKLRKTASKLSLRDTSKSKEKGKSA